MRRFWTPEEDATLREHYRQGADVVAATTGRGVNAVHARATRLRATIERRWSWNEDSKLVNSWGYIPICEVAQSIGRSIHATYRRARTLGLGSGCPKGFEYLETAARRVNISSKCLYRILVGADVKIRPAIGRHVHSVKRSQRCYVEAIDVDDAVKAWLATEVVGAAAKRHGIAACTLKRWLRAAIDAGVAMQDEPPREKHWRVSSAVIDVVVAARRAGSLDVRAMRLRPICKVGAEKQRRVA